MRRTNGFTLIELLVVMAIVAALLSIVTPRYIRQSDVAKEAVLRSNLASLRLALDQHYSDKGRYPDSLEQLVAQHYLRVMPLDPETDSRLSWVTKVRDDASGKKVIFDVSSGATGTAIDGTAFRSW